MMDSRPWADGTTKRELRDGSPGCKEVERARREKDGKGALDLNY